MYACFSSVSFSVSPNETTEMKIKAHIQGWEAQPHAHLNQKFKSINIC